MAHIRKQTCNLYGVVDSETSVSSADLIGQDK